MKVSIVMQKHTSIKNRKNSSRMDFDNIFKTKNQHQTVNHILTENKGQL